MSNRVASAERIRVFDQLIMSLEESIARLDSIEAPADVGAQIDAVLHRLKEIRSTLAR